MQHMELKAFIPFDVSLAMIWGIGTLFLCKLTYEINKINTKTQVKLDYQRAFCS